MQQMLSNPHSDGVNLLFVPEQMNLLYFRNWAVLISTIAKLDSPMEQIDDDPFFS